MVVTAYDVPRRARDRAGVDALLVGDWLGPVVLGYEHTLPVTSTTCCTTRARCRAAVTALVVADMPFMSYQV